MPLSFRWGRGLQELGGILYLIEFGIGSILHSIKSYSAKKIPAVMAHIGKVWQDGRHERSILDTQSLKRVREYIRQNPVKAGIAESPETYPLYWNKNIWRC